MGKKVNKQYWVTTDTHFGHEKIIKIGDRPKNYEQLMLNGLERIKENDVLIHLGDFAFENEEGWTEKFLSSLKGKAWLVKGNHDKRSDFWYLGKGWDFVGRSLTLKRFGKKILFSHMPQAWSGQFDLNIFGHFHNNNHRCWEEWLIERITPDKHYLLAQEEQNYVPIPLKSIVNDKVGVVDIPSIVWYSISRG